MSYTLPTNLQATTITKDGNNLIDIWADKINGLQFNI